VAVPTVGFEKPDWLDVITEGDAMAVPVRVDADTAPPALWINSTAPSRLPTPVGVNVTVAVHEACSSVAHVVDAIAKSPASAPVTVVAGSDRFQLTLGQKGLVKVTTCAAEVVPGATVPKSTAAGDGVTSYARAGAAPISATTAAPPARNSVGRYPLRVTP